MKGKVHKTLPAREIGWILGEDGKKYWFHFDHLRNGIKLEATDSVEFEPTNPEPPKGPAAKIGTIKKIAADTQEPTPHTPTALAATTSMAASSVPNADESLPRVSYTHKLLGNHLELTVRTGRANDAVQLYVNGKIPTFIPKTKKEHLRTSSDGTAKFVIPLSGKELADGALPIVVFVGSEMYVVSWSRDESTGHAEEAVPYSTSKSASVEPTFDAEELVDSLRNSTPVAEDKSGPPAADNEIKTGEAELTIRDITPEGQRDFMTIEIIHSVKGSPAQTKIHLSGKKKSEWAIRNHGEIDERWESATEHWAETAHVQIDVRIQKLAPGEFGGDHLIVSADSGQTANIYVSKEFVIRPSGSGGVTKETVH